MPNNRLGRSSTFANWKNIAAMVAALGVFVATSAHSQTWEYQSYYDGERITHPSDWRASPGYITLDESGDKPIFAMYAGTITNCFRGLIPAKVEKTIETTTIVVHRDLRGCGSARFVIKNDGTGGRREIVREGKWVWDGQERGLTLRR